jgi:hypothetical protein
MFMLQALGGWAEKYWAWLATALLALQIAVEGLLMGRPWVCTCGVKLWTGAAVMGESSQHVADWYTLSHIIHGMLFYWVLGIVARVGGWKVPVGVRLLGAMVIEIAWEFFENSSYVIERYRTATAAVDYAGDTVLNSGFDTIWMVLGFAIALKLRVRWTIWLAIGFELLAAWAVRDNLTLNVLTFLWPIQTVVDWQSAA